MLYCVAEIGVVLSITLSDITMIRYICLTNNCMKSQFSRHTLGVALHLPYPYLSAIVINVGYAPLVLLRPIQN